jgi:hypothetical protein
MILVASGIAIARGELDLTPNMEIHKMERVGIPRLVFHDGAKEIYYQPPRGWACTGSHNSVAFSIPTYQEAKAAIQSAAKLRIPAFDDKAQKLFEATPALLQLPKGAKDVKITEVDLNPLIVDSHKTLEVQLTYSFFGQSCAKSILLVDRNGAEVSFTLDCLAPDFQALHGVFRGSVFSIENL